MKLNEIHSGKQNQNITNSLASEKKTRQTICVGRAPQYDLIRPAGRKLLQSLPLSPSLVSTKSKQSTTVHSISVARVTPDTNWWLWPPIPAPHS